MTWLEDAKPVSRSEAGNALEKLHEAVEIFAHIPYDNPKQLTWQTWSIYYEYSTGRHHVRQARYRVFLQFHAPGPLPYSEPTSHPPVPPEIAKHFKDLCQQLKEMLQATLPESAIRITYHKRKVVPDATLYDFCDFVVYYASHSK